MKNKKAGLQEPTYEMHTDREPFTRALPGSFRRLRELRGLSQNALAALSKVSRPTLGNLEAEKYVPTAETVARLAKGVGLTFSQFAAEVERWLASRPAACLACKYACMVKGELSWLDVACKCQRPLKAIFAPTAILPVAP